MSVILRNEYGAVAVNKGVMERMIVEDLLSMGDDIILCSKKGKPIGIKPSRFMDPDYFDAARSTVINAITGNVQYYYYMLLASQNPAGDI